MAATEEAVMVHIKTQFQNLSKETEMHAELRQSNSHLAEIRHTHTHTNPIDSDKAGCGTIQGTTLTHTGSTYSMGLKPAARSLHVAY
jgi:hypothetical protein